MLDPTKQDELMDAPIVRLAERFAALVDPGFLKEGSQDYQLMEDAEIGMEEGGVQKYVDHCWDEITKTETANGTVAVSPNLYK